MFYFFCDMIPSLELGLQLLVGSLQDIDFLSMLLLISLKMDQTNMFLFLTFFCS